MKKIITLLQKKEWIDYVNRSKNHDFYHSWAYHTLDESGVPLLFVYEEGIDFIAFPLLKRNIPSTGYNDFSSVYGYSGPIANTDFKNLPNQFIDRFNYNFLNFLREENIISVFSRLHPFFDQALLLHKFGGVWDNGKVIVIDLTTSLEEQRANYSRTFRKIKQLKKKGYSVKEADRTEDIEIFTSMYTENMLRLDALKSYLFSEQYFIRLLNSDEFDARLLFVYNESGYPICGALVVFTNQIIQAHLLATRESYLAESPAKLMIDEITLLGREIGMKYFNLGGGLGFKEDTLFNWKSKFSDLTFKYHSWRYVVDQSAYDVVLDKFEIDHESTIDIFPLYRSKLQSV